MCLRPPVRGRARLRGARPGRGTSAPRRRTGAGIPRSSPIRGGRRSQWQRASPGGSSGTIPRFGGKSCAISRASPCVVATERSRVGFEGWGRALLDRQAPEGWWVRPDDEGWMATTALLCSFARWARIRSATRRTAFPRPRTWKRHPRCRILSRRCPQSKKRLQRHHREVRGRYPATR